MSWIEPNPLIQQRVCIVCGRRTREQAAPLGIVSGTMRCCLAHDDREVRTAFFKLLQEFYPDKQASDGD
jgi:hypothetical protein